MNRDRRKAEKGQWIGTGIAIGLIFGQMMHNIALGMTLGIVFGSLVEALSQGKREDQG